MTVSRVTSINPILAPMADALDRLTATLADRYAIERAPRTNADMSRSTGTLSYD